MFYEFERDNNLAEASKNILGSNNPIDYDF